MSDPHRLAELQRQRTLIATHLQWLDDQIAREQHGRPSPQMPLAPPASTTAAEPLRMHEPAEAALTSAALPARPGDMDVVPLQEAGPLPSKLGCWAAFAAMMLGLGTAVGLFIYFRYGR